MLHQGHLAYLFCNYLYYTSAFQLESCFLFTLGLTIEALSFWWLLVIFPPCPVAGRLGELYLTAEVQWAQVQIKYNSNV